MTTTLALASCATSNLIGPSNQLEVNNAVDDFQFQVSNLDRIVQTLTYTWECTGQQATIDISESITVGSAILTIRDDAGTTVHQEDLAQDNDTDTAVGAAGNWIIEVKFEGTSGTVNFRVQKKT
ncbi:MAG: hypothetical protein JSW51_05925 [Gemmatimonadota bacterium]|nr:MAG: hypothetical protein JSW51_05925 [Gemmatimonadota bacterium]